MYDTLVDKSIYDATKGNSTSCQLFQASPGWWELDNST